MKNPRSIFLVFLILFGLVGALFSAISTYDFIAHLDRQVHSVTCSFTPGLEKADTTGESGCYAVMMSPYSSVFRDRTWGGIPIAIPSLCVFAYLVFLGFELLFRKAKDKPEETVYAMVAWALPVIVSIVYWYISVSKIGTICKSCVGIYAASFGGFATAIAAFVASRFWRDPENKAPIPWFRYVFAFFEGVAFVAVPLVLFLAFKPAYTDDMFRCGNLIQPEDKYNVRIKLGGGSQTGSTSALVLLDPLCPACKAFHDRLHASDLMKELDLEAVVFPLDTECNWMLSKSLHPGACAVSEALLCAGGSATEVLDWAFENQTELREGAAKDPDSIYRQITGRFPAIADCLKKPLVKSRLNKSLRWIVSNAAEVMVPQLFIEGQKLCAEDSDLGLEFALSRTLATVKSGQKTGRTER